MCHRHRLPLSRALGLLPLVRRALEATDSVRDQILAHVEQQLAQRSGSPGARPGSFSDDLDEEVLSSVARILHNWSPSARNLGTGGALPNLFPDLPDPGTKEE